MFPSVKDRARQLFGEAAIPDTAPLPPVATGRRGAPLKAAAATKATPEPKTPAKTSRADARSKKDAAPVVEETPKAIGAWPSPFASLSTRTSPPATTTPPTPSKSKSSSKTATASKPVAPSKSEKPSKAEKSEKTSKSEKTEKSSKSDKAEKAAKAEKSSKSDKKSSSRPKTPPTPKPSGSFFGGAAKTATPVKKKVEPKPAPEPKKTSRPKLDTRTSSRPKMERSSSSSSLEDDDEYGDLRAACLREVSNVTGLKGKNLAISLRQRSSGGWYAALKDVGADKYLKMWMNRDKTFKTQDEALEAYLVFVKKMNTDMKLFGPMSPKTGKTKGFF
ncbi:hypothetical protein AA0111_g11457 [Alternaria arborescens]|uniref:hypothetical protein n=1 Tax=Alternaria arborescens TaxID=156630 RepID=UPI001074F0B9|nr:hypothetical protein AA0111_g11457 [Alternaria arborescens]RYO16162.1 hypothetical protein AA0111_g11457 [Alternaria arborescens]